MNGNILSMLNVNQKSLFPFFYFSLVFVCKVLLYIIELVLVLDMHELYATGHHASNDQSILAAYVFSLLWWNAKLYLLTKHNSYDSLPHADYSTGVTNRAGTAYPSRAPEFTPVFCGVRVTRSLVFCVCFVDRCLSFCTFFFWPLSCLFFFDIRILITPFVSSSFSYSSYGDLCIPSNIVSAITDTFW